MKLFVVESWHEVWALSKRAKKWRVCKPTENKGVFESEKTAKEFAEGYKKIYPTELVRVMRLNTEKREVDAL